MSDNAPVSFDEAILTQIASLARLHLDNMDAAEGNEAAAHKGHSLQEDLKQILTMINQLESVDIEGVAPLTHPLDMNAPLREDGVTETDQREALLAIAPETKKGLYIVPQVLETE